MTSYYSFGHHALHLSLWLFLPSAGARERCLLRSLSLTHKSDFLSWVLRPWKEGDLMGARCPADRACDSALFCRDRRGSDTIRSGLEYLSGAPVRQISQSGQPTAGAEDTLVDSRPGTGGNDGGGGSIAHSLF